MLFSLWDVVNIEVINIKKFEGKGELFLWSILFYNNKKSIFILFKRFIWLIVVLFFLNVVLNIKL